MTETWKDVVGYEGLYKVSSDGRVYGEKRNNVLKPANVGGYLQVVLCKNGERKNEKVHRIVATAFCAVKDGANQVNHINENKHDNRAENLEWCTCLENIRHGTGIQRRSLARLNNEKSKAICQYTKDGKLVAKYPSIHEMHRVTGYDRSTVVRNINGKIASSYGYVWRYANGDRA